MRLRTCLVAGTFLAVFSSTAIMPCQACLSTSRISMVQDDDPFAPIANRNHNNNDPFASASGGESNSNPIASTSTNGKSHSTDSTNNSNNSDKNTNSSSINVVRTIYQTDQQTEEKLQLPISFDFNEIPFVEIMDQLSDDLQCNVLLDQSARDDSLMEDELVTFSIRNVRLSTSLRLMLREKNATYLIDDGTLRIISLDVAGNPEYLRRKVFDCRNLLEKISKTEAAKFSGFERRGGLGGNTGCSGGGIGGGGSGKGGGVFCIPPGCNQIQADGKSGIKKNAQQQIDATRKVHANEILSNLIRATISPESWTDTNGDGTMVIVGSFLIVVQSQGTLEQVDALIKELDANME